jgi:thiol-disulfide isomerase/thioredoxin
MKRVLTTIAVLGAVVLFDSMLSQTVAAAEAPADRVVVMYFHRTQRCPTCKKMGGYAEEAVAKGFAKEIKTGKVEFHFIDFQDEKNETLTKGYKVEGPTLIVARVVNKKVKDQKNLNEMWTKVRDKDAFIEYVQSNVKEYMKKETTATSPDKKTK